MRWAVAVFVAMMLAGCLDGDADEDGPGDGTGTSGDPTGGGAGDGNGTSVVLVDMDWTYTNGAPSPFGNDVTVTEFQVDQAFSRVEATFTRSQAPLEVFATNCRIWDADGEMDQNAFSGDSCIATLSTGSMGTWRLSYFVEHTEPGGQHALHVTATGYV